MLVAIGVNQDGYCEVLGVVEGTKEDKASWLAIICAWQGRLEAARKHWKKALELDPNYEDARRNLSLLQRLQGHCREDLFTPASGRTKSELIWLRRDG